ncbi:MAG: ABC transporter permease [Thermoplasmata archaeon]|nr:MAG: ABC transporter permease [Thermoplasmata archaeon]
MQKKIIVGMVLCIMLFSASVPILMGVKSSPDTIFRGEDTITLSQTNINTPISASLAERLNEQDFVEVASPEIYAFSYVLSRETGKYEPVVVRGVGPENFLKIEDAEVLEGDFGDDFMLVGEGLAKRLNLKEGHCITITGSLAPAILELTVTGIFSSKSSSNDHILIPLRDARKLMDLEDDDVLAIRVKTKDQQALMDFLTEEKYSVVVSWEGASPIAVNENKTYEEQIAEDLAIKYTDPGGFSASNQSFVSTFVQKGSTTIGVVIFGFIALNAILTFIGVTAILARTIIERKKDIGILAAIGADKKTIYLILLKDLLIISIISSGIGVILGFVTALVVQELDLIVAFGHTIQPTIDLSLFVITFFVAIIIGCISGLLVSAVILTAKPSKLIKESEEIEEITELETLADAVVV